MKIEWAPIKMPPRRRLQTLATGLYVYIVLFLPFMSMFLTIFFLVSGNFSLLIIFEHFSNLPIFQLYLSFMGRAILLLYLSFIYYDHKKHFSNIYGNG